MIRRLLILALVAAIMWPAAARATDTAPTEISVSGQATVTQAPDIATIDFAIVTNDDAAERATSEDNAIYQRLVANLRQFGITEQDLHTYYYNLNNNPRPQNPPQSADPQTRYGYVVSRGIELSVTQLGNVGKIVDASVAAGVTAIGGVTYGLRDSKPAYAQALAQAIAQARSQAQTIAAAAHLRILSIKTIGESSSYSAYQSPSPHPLGGVLRQEAVPTNIQPSNVRVDAQVEIVYEAAP